VRQSYRKLIHASGAKIVLISAIFHKICSLNNGEGLPFAGVRLPSTVAGVTGLRVKTQNVLLGLKTWVYRIRSIPKSHHKWSNILIDPFSIVMRMKT